MSWGKSSNRASANLEMSRILWRGSLLPLGCVAAPSFCERCALKREQAPSPQSGCIRGNLLMHCWYSNNSLRADIQFLP
ncbi:hypothetical protein QF010_002869 [Pseudomonas silensiensis]